MGKACAQNTDENLILAAMIQKQILVTRDEKIENNRSNNDPALTIQTPSLLDGMAQRSIAWQNWSGHPELPTVVMMCSMFCDTIRLQTSFPLVIRSHVTSKDVLT